MNDHSNTQPWPLPAVAMAMAAPQPMWTVMLVPHCVNYVLVVFLLDFQNWFALFLVSTRGNPMDPQSLLRNPFPRPNPSHGAHCRFPSLVLLAPFS